MKLKRVEIQGFKSFVDRTVIDFHQGITAIVGPNGCGKSNLVDSIRWVLGETNARTLRGSLMDDVIFSGTEQRAPLGMAEVSLTLHNEDGMAPAQYQAVPEITITRRVFRDGDSEYLINKTPCRLKDIHDLFMGTGASIYSVIEQGKIHTIVSAKPDELRSFIEEAAGITFYRSRKRAALRRIEATQKNLLRVSDIISEISRQINYLERQARKAERYREMRDRLRSLEINANFQEIQKISHQLTTIEGKKSQMGEVLVGVESKSTHLASEGEDLKIELHEQEAKVQQSQKTLFEAGKSLAERENQKLYLERELDELGKRRVNLSQEVERLKLKIELTQEELVNGNSELKQLTENNRDFHERLAGLEDDQKSVEAAVEQLQQKLDTNQEKLMQQLSKVSGLDSQLTSMQERSEHQREEINRWLKEKESIEGELHSLSVAETTKQQNKTTLDERKQQLAQRGEDLGSSFEAVGEQLVHLREKRDGLKEQYTQASSKLESILALQREGDVQQFMQTANTRVDGAISGTLSQIIHVDAKHEKAVEAFLGERLQWIATANDQDPAQLMQKIMADGNLPRATLISAQLQDGLAEIQLSESITGDGVIGRMSELIRCNPEHKNLITYLSGHAWVVENLQKAADLSKNVKLGTPLVTLDGDMVIAGAEVTAGSMGDKFQSVLERKREVEQLQTTIEQLEGQLETVTAETAEATHERESLEQAQETLQNDREEMREQQLQLERELATIEADKRQVEQRLESLKRQNVQADASHKQTEESTGEIQVNLAEASTLHQELKQEEAQLREQHQEGKDKLANVREAWTKIRVDNASAIEREDHLNQEQVRLKNDLESHRNSEKRLQSEVEQLWTREQNGREEFTNLEETLTSLREQVAEFEETFQECQRTYQATNSKLQQAELTRREHDGEAQQLTKSLAEIEIELREMTVRKEHLRDLTIEKWKVDLAVVTPEPIEITEETAEEVEQLRSSMERMGEVNLGAVEEHAFLQERFDFLSTQRSDLDESLSLLNKTIKKIDATTRKLFFEAFDGINEHFGKMFPRFFRGGKAELALTGDDDTDPLERGITIIARPPGKRPQNINLLSGGEKALTAASLVFAIFKYRPSPFSILDEVDAPLDEANTRRFNSIASEISLESQLVIITHNKRTMEIAQNLYGVTMQEPGVSKVVSVNLEESEAKQTAKQSPVAEETTEEAVA